MLHICKAAPHSIGKFIFLKLASGAEKKVRISSSVLRFWDKAWEVIACSTTGGHAMAFVKQQSKVSSLLVSKFQNAVADAQRQ